MRVRFDHHGLPDLTSFNALRSRNRDVAYCELTSNYGHDAFLVDIGEQTEILRGFLASSYKEKG